MFGRTYDLGMIAAYKVENIELLAGYGKVPHDAEKKKNCPAAFF